MNRLPQHKASQYTEFGVALHHLSPTHGGSHAPIGYAHQDDYYILGLLTRGRARGLIDFKETQLVAGDVFLVQPGQVHRFIDAEQASGWLLMADGKFVSAKEKCIFDNFAMSASSLHLNVAQVQELRQIALLLDLRVRDNMVPRANAVATHLAEAFIAVMAEAVQEQSHKQTTQGMRYTEIVLSFRQLLAEHLATHRQPSYYASLLNISMVYLNEVVKKVTGMSTAAYIKGEIVLQAKRLLASTSLSVKQIAGRLGFDDGAYFSRLFSQATGISPTEFRQRNLV